MSDKMSKLHQEVYEYLQVLHQERPELCFMLRNNNIDNRLSKGYYLWGNDASLYFSFWHGVDRSNNTPNISITIWANGDMYVYFNAKDSEGKAVFFEKLAQILGKFTRTKNFQTNEFENSWRRSYVREGWKEGLRNFIDNDFDKINTALSAYQEEFEYLREMRPYTLEDYEANIKKFIDLKDFIDRLKASQNNEIPIDKAITDTIKLKEIHLRNIGHFGDVTIPLDKRITVLIGENGSGKSTVLRALGLSLTGVSPFRRNDEGLLDSELFSRWLKVSDYTETGIPKYDASGLITLVYYTQTNIEERKEYQNQVEFTFKEKLGVIALDVFEGDREFFYTMENETEMNMLCLGFPQGGGYQIPIKLEDDNKPDFTDLLPIIRDEAHHKLMRLRNWIDVNYTNYLTAKEKQDLDAENYLNKIRDVFKLISLVISENEKEDMVTFSTLHVQEKGKSKEVGIILEISSPNRERQKISLDLVSQGYQNLFYWIGELVSRCYQVNEYYKMNSSPKFKESIFDMEGIIMIDEIDTYLHIKWQRNILKVLASKFKNMYFIVTTHSLSAVPSVKDTDYAIYRAIQMNSWNGFTEEKPQFGFSLDQTAEDIFKEKNKDKTVYEAEIMIEDLIASNKFAEAKAKITELNPESIETRRLETKLKTQAILNNVGNI